MNFNKFLLISISFCLIVFLFSVSEVLAQNNTGIDVSCAKYQYPWCQEAGKGPSALVGRFYIIALGLAAAAALGVLIYGAVLWTVSGAVTSKQDALEWIKGALWGLVLLLGAYLILYTINPDLVKLRGPEELFKLIKVEPTETSGDIGSGYQQYQWAQIPMNQYCKDILGSGWVTVDTTHCQGPRPGPSYDCCGK